MRFCPNDRSLMVPARRDGRAVLRCPKCGYEEEAANPSGYRASASVGGRAEVVVVEEQRVSLPKVKTRGCPKCGHEEAYFWVQQTRAADEPPTRFYRCVQCGHVWREYE